MYNIEIAARFAQRRLSLRHGHGTEHFFVRLLTGRCPLCVSNRQPAAPLTDHLSESTTTEIRAVNCCCIRNAYPITQPNNVSPLVTIVEPATATNSGAAQRSHLYYRGAETSARNTLKLKIIYSKIIVKNHRNLNTEA